MNALTPMIAVCEALAASETEPAKAKAWQQAKLFLSEHEGMLDTEDANRLAAGIMSGAAKLPELLREYASDMRADSIDASFWDAMAESADVLDSVPHPRA